MPYSDSPRSDLVVIHHTGSANAHNVYDSRFCSAGYDFTIDRNGNLYVCATPGGQPRWELENGVHASGCDCEAIGIMMHGCFGGTTCGGSDPAAPSKAQECRVGALLVLLGTPATASHIRPHAFCNPQNPCSHASPLATVCCGTNYTSGGTAANQYWNASGVSLRNRFLLWRSNYINHNCCDPNDGPCPVSTES